MKKNDVIHICCVDSVNEGIVRLLPDDGGKVCLLPLELFPKGIKEGDWINLTISIDKEATLKGKLDVANLYGELRDNN